MPANLLSKDSAKVKDVSTPVVIAVIVVVLIVVASAGFLYSNRSHRKPPPPQLSERATNAQGQLIVPGAGPTTPSR